MTVLGVAIWPFSIPGIVSEPTDISAMATASPFRLDRRTVDPEGRPFGIETTPGLASGAP